MKTGEAVKCDARLTKFFLRMLRGANFQVVSRIIEVGTRAPISALGACLGGRRWEYAVLPQSAGALVIGEHRRARSDSELLSLSRDGDGGAFAELWNRHRRAGHAAARSIAPSLDSDDLVAGAYLKIFELVREGRGPTGAFRPYLYRVISSLAADAFRSPEHAVADLEAIPALSGAGPWEDEAFDRDAAARAFAALPERWRTVLWYTVVEGLPPREVAPMLGLSANGVSALAARAREGLQAAWVESHADMEVADVACRTVRQRLQSYRRGRLTAKRRREVAAHLGSCEACAAVDAEFQALNSQLALVLSVVVLGVGSAAAFASALAAGTGVSAVAAAAVGSAPGVGGLSGGASGGAGAGFGGATIATIAVASVALVAAAAGGVLLLNSLSDRDAGGAAPIEAAPRDREVDPAEAGSEGHDAGGSGPAAEFEPVAPSRTGETPVPLIAVDPPSAAVPQPDPGERATPVPPEPSVVPPDPVGPTDPVDPVDPESPNEGLLPGAECFAPDVDAGQYVVSGRSSAPGTVELRFPAELGGGAVAAVTGGDRNWSSQALPALAALVGGASPPEARLVTDAAAGPWTPVPVAQCGGTGPTVVSTLSVPELCAAMPAGEATARLDGTLSEYGVVFARHRAPAGTTPIVDPLLDGAPDLRYPWVAWHGILSRADLWEPHSWTASFPIDASAASVAEYNAGRAGLIELRVQTPGFWWAGPGTTSPWMPVDQLVECGS